MNISSQRKIVCMVNVTSARGGGPEQMFGLLKNCRRDKWDAIVLTQKDGEYWKKIEDLGYPIFSLNIRRISIVTFFKMLRLVKKHRPNILHSHGRGAGLYARLTGLILGIPVVHTFHGFDLNNFNSRSSRLVNSIVEKLLNPLASKYICVGSGEKEKLLKSNLVEDDQVRVILNGIEIEKYSGLASRSALDTLLKFKTSEYFVVGAIARIHPQKGLEYMLEGFAKFHQDNRKSILVIVGGCPDGSEKYQEQIKLLVKVLKIEDAVFFVGYIDNVSDILCGFDVYLTTSLWEGLPLSLLEAIACKKFIIASDIPGHNELIVHDVTGLLVPSADSGAVCTALKSASENYKTQVGKECANGAYKMVQELYSVQTCSEKTYSLYEEILEVSGRS